MSAGPGHRPDEGCHRLPLREIYQWKHAVECSGCAQDGLIGGGGGGANECNTSKTLGGSVAWNRI